MDKIMVQSLIIIFLIIFLGIACHKRKVLNPEQIEGFQIFLFKLAMPCYLFTSTLNHDLGLLLHTKYIASYLITFSIIALLLFIVFYKKITAAGLCIRMLASGYVNTAIYALPIIVSLMQNPKSGIISLLIQIIIIQSTFIIIFNFIQHKEHSIYKKLLSAIKTPLIMMPILGLLCNFLQINLPLIITEPLHNLGTCASTLALFTFGLTLGDIKINKESMTKDLLMMLLIKNILHPIVAFGVGKYLLNLEPYWLKSLIIITSSPPAFLVYLIAKQFAIETILIKRLVAISSIISLITLVIITLIL